MLEQLEFPKSISVDLFHSWITPTKETRIEISSDEQGEFSGQIMELAVLEENEIRIAMSVPEHLPLQRGDAVELAFHLKGELDLIQVQGTGLSPTWSTVT